MSKRQMPRVVLSAAFALAGLGSGSARAQEIDELFNLNPPAAPQGIALGADHNLWFVERVGNRVGRITPQADVTEFSAGISANAGPHEIAAGPDGNLWFTEFGVGRIGRITPAGAVTEFNAATSSQPPAAQPFGIAAGPDGNLWFTDPTRGVIGRITPGGLVTSFSDGLAPGAVPVAITRGPDGNMWFTEAANRIGRITMSGVVTEFSSGITANAQPNGITAGPDGNVWFTESAANRIGRITPAGVVTEFGDGITPASDPRGIALGPDGNLWFVEHAGNRIGRITPAGVVTEFGSAHELTPAAGLYGIAAGAGGELWFTEETTNGIGKISVVAPPAIAIAFGAATLPLNGSTSLTYTLRNPNLFTQLTQVSFTDGLPAALVLSKPGTITGSCGDGALAAAAGVVSLSDGTLAPVASCTFSVSVRAIMPGVWTDTTGEVTSLEGGTGAPASATLNVVGVAPAITSPASAAFTVGVPGTFGVTTTGSPVPAVTITGNLPEGVGFVDNRNGTATLYGTPDAGSAGTYPLTVRASNVVGPDATQTLVLTVSSSSGTALHFSIEPARPTATDDILVRSSLPPGGCRLLDSPFRETRAGVFEGLVFVTTEPDGCAADDTRPEARLPLRATAPGRYHVVLWKITGNMGSTPETPETRADADVTVGDAEWLIPAAARTEGVSGAHWTTDLEIFSTNAAADTPVTLAFLASGGAEGNAPQATVSVPPLGSVRVQDVLDASFGIQQGSGAILLTSPSLGLRFVASIGTNLGGGRIAQVVPAVPGREKLRTGQSAVLVGIREDETARTNLALANAGGLPAVVDLVLATGATSADARTSVTVPARGMTQVNRVVRALGVEGPVAGGRLTVTAHDAADGVAVLATVIDNATNSPHVLKPE